MNLYCFIICSQLVVFKMAQYTYLGLLVHVTVTCKLLRIQDGCYMNLTTCKIDCFTSSVFFQQFRSIFSIHFYCIENILKWKCFHVSSMKSKCILILIFCIAAREGFREDIYVRFCYHCNHHCSSADTLLLVLAMVSSNFFVIFSVKRSIPHYIIPCYQHWVQKDVDNHRFFFSPL